MNTELRLSGLWLGCAVIAASVPLSACEGDGAGPVGRPSQNFKGGYFFGSAYGPSVGADNAWADALVTQEGRVSLYLPMLPGEPTGSVMYIGTLTHGTLVGQQCRSPLDGDFCGGGIPAELDLSALRSDRLSGKLHWELGEGPGIVGFSMYGDAHGDFGREATLSRIEGTYVESRAPMSGGQMVFIVDGAGNWFFQSAHSGCVGNGTIAPHADGTVNVYDAELLIENCSDDFRYLNRSFTGLATLVTLEDECCGWGFPALIAFLSTPEGEPAAVALTMEAWRQ